MTIAKPRKSIDVAVLLAFTTGTLITAIVEETMPKAHQTQDTDGQP